MSATAEGLTEYPERVARVPRAASVTAARVTAARTTRRDARARPFGERIALVGDRRRIDALVDWIAPMRRVSLVGAASDDAASLEALATLAAAGAVDRIVVAVPAEDATRRERALAPFRAIDVALDLDCGRGCDRPALRCVRRRAIPAIARWLKEAGDRSVALLLLLLLAPLLVATALSILATDRGPVLFRQARAGRNGVAFTILKFRTMRVERAPAPTLRQTMRGDPRVTAVGAVLRRTSLDELPQLWNVLRGDMSLIGPRPHPRDMRTEDRLGHEITPRYEERYRVKPGMTGWAQVNGSRGALDSADALLDRVRFDLDYVERWTLGRDLLIALLTPFRLVFHGGRAF